MFLDKIMLRFKCNLSNKENNLKSLFTVVLLLFSMGVKANYQISSENVEGVIITQNIEPSKSCVSKGTVSVGIHGTESVKEKLAKEAKKQGGNFVFIRMESPYYSYKYGGDLYFCN